MRGRDCGSSAGRGEGVELESQETSSELGAARRAIRAARAALRLLAFSLATLAIAVVWFAGLAFVSASAPRRKRWRDFVFRSWARVSLACAGVRASMRGSPPAAPCFLVSNHLCYLDVWMLASRTSCTFVAQSEIAAWPFFGFMARQLGIVFIARERKRAIPDVNRAIEVAFARGHVLAIFPESTTSDGSSVLPFRTSLLEPAASGAHPVAWATIGYRTRPPDPPASSAVCWTNHKPLRGHAWRMLKLDRIEATVTFGSGVVRASDRKDLARELQRRVEAQLVPVI